ncbi:MAG: TIGR01777 family oxidoreductase [Parachlamydiaceae bacterium]
MKILISGASGLIGSALQHALMVAGHHVVVLVRDQKKISEQSVFWDPENGVLDPQALQGVDAVINLAGDNLSQGRWSKKKKRAVLNSRVMATKTLIGAMSRCQSSPKVLINASAVGIYGGRGDEICTEATSVGAGFLADVCRQWEEAAAPAMDNGIRTVFLRTGVVLSSQGGALAKMLPLFKLGLGGNLGTGKQYLSWVAIEDVISIILFALVRDDLKGAINVVAPNAVTNAEFTKILGHVLHRPTVLPVPAFMLRWVVGKEMADELLLSSIRAEPLKLEMLNYEFKYPYLKDALKHYTGDS